MRGTRKIDWKQKKNSQKRNAREREKKSRKETDIRKYIGRRHRVALIILLAFGTAGCSDRASATKGSFTVGAPARRGVWPRRVA